MSRFVFRSAGSDDLDPLDPLPPPAPLQLRRPCAKTRCRQTARPGGRYCRRCATEASARWYRAHQAEILARRCGHRDERGDEDRARDSARSYVAVYLRRGKLERRPCEVCKDPNVQPTWRDPRHPLEVRWLCREHARDQREAADAHAREVTALRTQFGELTAAIALLPPGVQRELHDQAMRGILVRRVGDLMYYWNLRRAFTAHESASSSDGFFQ